MSELHGPCSSSGSLPEQATVSGLCPGNTRRLLRGSYLGMFLVATSVNAVPVCLTAIGASFGLATKTQLGLIAPALFAGKVPAIIFAGPLADRFGLRCFLLTGAVLNIIGLVLMGMAPTYYLLLAAGFLMGIGSAVFDVLLDPLVCTLRPTAKTSALNLLHAFYPIGAIGTVVAATAILNWTDTWRVVFPVMVLPAAAYLIYVVPCKFPQIQLRKERIPVLRLLTTPLFAVIVLLMIIVACTELGPGQWLPAYMEQVFRWPRSGSASILLAFSIFMAVGRLAASGLARRFKPMGLLLLAALLSIICLLIGSVAGSAWTAATGLSLLGLAVACMWPSTVAYAADRFPAGGATMFSMLVAAGNIGGILGPALIGALGDYRDLRWGMGSIACLPLAAALIFLWRLWADRTQSGSPTPVDRQPVE